ncbi:Conserved hypothetical protein CHP02453 [Penicillium angulare]|uniref:Conserved hypothetical protein CHP02453 n=1 Tax=Penicillium angulare TaxID=116970 RepID=UPI0025406D79|nr:Conserved hypothetical protein CHP02453 [Penicillium angulare]KAJ5263246.1 Conserved hypothetical protein CHP02453 [Penicillium angulare]
MARRSQAGAGAEAAAGATAPKRRASARLSASQGEIKRVKSNNALSVKSTSKKSKYFEPTSSDEEEGDEEDESDSGSAYEEKEEVESEGSPDPESGLEELEDSGVESDEAQTSSKSKSGKTKQVKSRGSAGSSSIDTKALKDKELWREGVRTGLGPGKEVFVPKPKAREAGNVPYQDEKLHPNTKLFLLDLKENNDRQWLKAHDPDFRAAKKDFETFVETLSEKISEADGTIPELPTKDLIHFSAAWSRTGKKGPYAAYYVHFQPGSSFVGCGLWNPESDALASLREDIDENAHQWKEVLRAPEMRREFMNDVRDDEDAVVKAFCQHNKESALKTKPKGYDADNKNIELLRLRSFTIGRSIPDAHFMAADAQERIVTLIGIMEPLVTYLNSVVMPDQ